MIIHPKCQLLTRCAYILPVLPHPTMCINFYTGYVKPPKQFYILTFSLNYASQFLPHIVRKYYKDH